ncbi:PD-(D/E)XK motif protein [Cupriavidus pinatubonensis]|uniref:MZA anti-phage system associated PD-(D/E)XK motif protein MzaD n=1 Tax=Cupriavidus pinatubonensis TaxID=248026 RepID=UPI001C72AE7B|nr:MZA anti-phage system associated PD-(D/E)XK motif protein MzaD [Cupriavidus pinatubonensis]QYY31647.1 PD-(D/E)XK motif protein [Cupriavidus pinatubonensis]
MAPQNNAEIAVAWRALAGVGGELGWRCIPVSTFGSVSLQAGRSFPGNTEALLVGFAGHYATHATAFPQGNGFRVERAEVGVDGKHWLALVRQPSASLELFTLMVEDISAVLAASRTVEEASLFQLFLGRIRAWQSFMKNGDEALGPEAELGLVGELNCLEQLLANGLPAQVALDAWVGPDDGLQDFELGGGAIEVKSTLAVAGFPAKIQSLDQLDDSVRRPLYVCGCRFRLGDDGLTLAERVERLRETLERGGAAARDFNLALLHARYLDSHADRYHRRFVEVDCQFLLVDDVFPRLTPGMVPPGVRGARYEIDLDQIQGSRTAMADVLSTLMGE